MKRALNFLIRYILSVYSLFLLHTIGLLFSDSRKHLWRLSKHLGIPVFFNQEEPSPQLSLPKQDVNEMIPSRENAIIFPAGQDGNISTLELLFINHLVRSRQCQNIFEIGTFNGRTALNMALNSPANAKIFTLDLPAKDEASTTYPLEDSEKCFVQKPESGGLIKSSGCKEKNKITQLFGDSAKFDFGPYRNSMDFVLIDGSHQYDYILNDARVALSLLKNEKGVIAWHDYNPGWPGVVKAINELSLNEPYKNMYHICDTSLVILIL